MASVAYDDDFVVGRTASRSVDLPSFGAIAFIPFEDRFHRPPGYTFTGRSDYHTHPFEARSILPLRGHVFCKLFATGNQTSGQALHEAKMWDDSDWIEHIDRQFMRAAVALDDLQANVDTDGQITGITGRCRAVIGDTLAGLRALTTLGPVHPRYASKGKGEPGGDWGGRSPRLERAGSTTVFEHGVRFKIGTLGDIIGKLMTRHRAPTTYLVIRLELTNTTGNLDATAFVRAPAIPSWFAWCGVRGKERSMIWNSHGEIDAFMNSPTGGLLPLASFPMSLRKVQLECP